MDIQTIEDIQRLVRQPDTDWTAVGCVYAKYKDNLILLNYTPEAAYGNVWTPLELMSRGLILDTQTGEVVARPFDKFFNVGENGRMPTTMPDYVTEKVDGSLGILYRHDGEYHIATRGSFDSEQALWATAFLRAHYDLAGLPDEYTLLFEIVYPENRIVINYGERQDLVLLAVRNRFTGEYLPWWETRYLANTYGFSSPEYFPADSLNIYLQAAELLDGNKEGFVITCDDGTRWKIKGAEYLKLHKLISALSFKNTLRAMQTNELQAIYDAVPDEFLGDVKTWVADIQHTVTQITEEVQTAFNDAPKSDRKTFALWVMANHKPLSSYLFAMLDGKPVEPLVYKSLEQDDVMSLKGEQ